MGETGKEDAVEQNAPGLCRKDDGAEEFRRHIDQPGKVAKEVVRRHGQQDGKEQESGIVLAALALFDNRFVFFHREHAVDQLSTITLCQRISDDGTGADAEIIDPESACRAAFP